MQEPKLGQTVAWLPGGHQGASEEEGAATDSDCFLTSVHEAMQGAVRRPHQVDQAGLAVAHRVRLCNGKGDRSVTGVSKSVAESDCPTHITATGT